MNDVDLRPRSSTEIVDAAFQLFRRSPAQLMLAAALVYVPWLVIRLVFDLGITDPMMGPDKMLAFLAGTLIVYAIVGGVVSILASDIYLGHAPDLVAAFRITTARFVTLALTGLIRAVLIAVGIVFFLLPGLYALSRFFAVTQSVMLENKGVGGAMSRSSALSVDLKRHIVNTLLLILLVSLAISVGVGLLTQVFQSKVITNVVGTAVSVVIYPLFGLTETLLYYDARIRKEGFDVEYLARADTSAAASENAAL
jgi:hypothetical protein